MGLTMTNTQLCTMFTYITGKDLDAMLATGTTLEQTHEIIEKFKDIDFKVTQNIESFVQVNNIEIIEE